MTSKPLSFHDLPTEIRNLIYRYTVTCEDEEVWPEDPNLFTYCPDLSQAATFLLVSKIINTEASPVFYANHHFCFNNISSAVEFISEMGRQNASDIKMLYLGSMCYPNWEVQTSAHCEKDALKDLARTLARLCTGLELLEFMPQASDYPRCKRTDDTPFKYWTDDAFAAVKALTVAFSWLKYVAYDQGKNGELVRMTSIEAMQVDGKVRFAVQYFWGQS